ncbi:hypothetical protein [Agrobacterium sp. CFBP2214]|uniref:hypothetical protein n=1 Tax=Agrobacterium TaxID=357 RepID=UPI000DD0590C|nr:hypothetical protein [Agrobacterium sp. CFBP2214]
MQKYTIDKLANSERLRKELFETIDWVIANAKAHGFAEVAISHAKAKKKVQYELNLIIDY